MEQANSAASQVGSMSASLTQIITPRSGVRLDSIHRALNMGDQNIGVLNQTLTGIFNVVGTLEQKMHHMSQNGTDHLIRGNLTN